MSFTSDFYGHLKKKKKEEEENVNSSPVKSSATKKASSGSFTEQFYTAMQSDDNDIAPYNRNLTGSALLYDRFGNKQNTTKPLYSSTDIAPVGSKKKQSFTWEDQVKERTSASWHYDDEIESLLPSVNDDFIKKYIEDLQKYAKDSQAEEVNEGNYEDYLERNLHTTYDLKTRGEAIQRYLQKNPNAYQKSLIYQLADAHNSVLQTRNSLNQAEDSYLEQKRDAKKDERWFKGSEVFDDGYQLWDVSKMILGTLTDTSEEFLEGAMEMGEKVVDAGAGVVGTVGGWFGAKDFRDKADEFADKDLYNSEELIKKGSAFLSVPGAINALIGNDTEAASIYGSKSEGILNSAGQLAVTAAIAPVVPWSVTTGVTSFGAEFENALNQGATHDEAMLSASASAAAEIITEKMFGGSGLGEKGWINTQKWTAGISNDLVRTLASYGVDLATEGAEEVVAEFAGNLASSLYEEEDILTLIGSKEAWQSYLDAFVGGALLSGGMNAGKTINSIKTGQDYHTGLTSNEQKVFNKELENRLAEAEKDGKLSNKDKAAIYDDVMNAINKGYISTDTIEEVLGGDSYKTYRDTVDSEDAQIKQIEDQLKELEGAPNTVGNSKKYDSLQSQLEELKKNSQRDRLKALLSKDVYELTKGDKLVESYFERVRADQKFQADLNQYTGRARDVIQKVMDSGLADNTNKTHEFWDWAAKMSDSIDTDITLANDEQILEFAKAAYEADGIEFDASKFDGQRIDGIFSKNGIVLNAQSNRALNFVVGHEITHKLEGTKHYEKLQKLLFEYAKDEYDSRFKKRSGQYSNQFEADDKYKTKVDQEVTGDLVGDYIFNDKGFIDHLAKDQNVFQQVWNEIKHMAKIATAGSEQARQLEKAKREFERAFREAQKNNVADDTKFSLEKSNKSKYNKRSRYSETETLFLSWENGSAPVGEVKKFVRYGKIHYYEKTENGCVELSRSQYNERNVAYVENIDRRAERETGEAYDYDESTQRGTPRHSDGYRDTSGTAAVFGQAFSEELQYDTEGSVPSALGYDSRTDIKQSEYSDEASDDSGASFVTFSNDYSTIRNFMKDGDVSKDNTDPDIRFSLSESVEETKDLVALHNLTADKLSKSLELGGLPMPSLAITKADIPHSNFGEITLIFGRETIDPKANKKNKAYSADAWTPVFPRVEYEADSKVANRVSQKLRDIGDKIDGHFQRDLNRVNYGFENYLNSDGGEEGLIQRVMDNYGMKAAYLEEQGKHIEAVTTQQEAEKNFNPDSADKYQKVMDILGVTTAEEVGKVNLKDAIDNHGAELEAVYPGMTKTSMRMGRLLGVVKSYIESKDAAPVYNTVVDNAATQKAVDNALDAEGYEAWVRNLFSGIVKDSGIYNNKDIFTPSGNRRSFKQTHLPFTLENIVKAMASQNNGNSKNVSGFNGIKTLRAATAETFKSVDEMHQRKGRLQNRTQEEADALNDALQTRLFRVMEAIDNDSGQIGDRNPYIRLDSIGEILTEIGESGKYGVADIQRVFKEYSRDISDDTAMEVKQLLYDVVQMPVNIFESKPQRVVGFDEAKVFVIPRNTDVKLKQELLNRGYSIAEYDPDVEGDRQKVVNQFEEYQFSLSNIGEQHKDTGSYQYYSHIPNSNNGIAPVQETAPVADRTVSKMENVAPVSEMFPDNLAPMEDSPDRLESLTDEDAPPVEDIAPTYDVEGKKGVPDGQQSFMPDEGEQKKLTRPELHKGIVDDIKSTFSTSGYDFDKVLRGAKNLSTFSTVDNTPQRVMEKALGYKEGGVLADLTVNKVAQNETEGIKWLNSFTDRKSGLLAKISKQYNIKPGSKESAAAQMYAEGFYVNENNEIIQYGDAELAKDFPNATVQKKIKGLAGDSRIRQIYDDTLAMINESRTRNAYPEIPRLDNYFLHFRAMEDTFSKLGLPFNPNDIRAKDLPTDLNGVTADLKPGQPYFASAMHRTGKRTSFDLLGGLERYLSSAKNQIYHIDDIQTLRALRNYIADTYGQANGLEGLDVLSEEEAQDRIEKVYNSHLSTFAKFLNEEANILAGKTALIDRGLEGIIGRRGITFLDTVNKQVGSNMVGMNVSSSLTNFLPVVQTFAKTNKFDFTKAFAQTVANKVGSVFGKNDGFAESSPVIIRRKGADRFYRTPWQKAGDAGYVFMSAVDDISTELIARTKYNELTRKGMDSQQAHFETDKWVSRLMGDRSLGQMPQLYNSKMLGLFTKFQLEVRNQLDSQFYDTIQEAKVSTEDIENGLARNAKTAAKVGSTFFQLAVAQHLFGKAFESVAGYNPSFDIIGVLLTAFGFDDDEESEDTALDNIEQGFLELLGDLPYTSTLTGGRIPISSALPVEQFITGKDQYGNEMSRWDTLKEVAPYYVLPGGYGQIKKTAQGLDMFNEDHPIAGSYTDSGKLRFPVEDTIGNRVQAGIFGQWASENARDYFDNERKALTEEQIQEFIDLDVPIQDYWEYREGLSGLDTLAEKADYIWGLDLPLEKKNLLVNNLSDREDPIDLEDYEKYGSFEDLDFAQKYPEKYNFLKKHNISVSEYKSFDDETKEAYTWAANNPKKYVLSQAVSDDFLTYYKYRGELNDIRADKDSNGNSISGSAKEKKIDYINNLDLEYGQKIILFKSLYNADDTYNADIVDYLNSRDDISYDEMETILKELGFTVKSDGTITWD